MLLVFVHSLVHPVAGKKKNTGDNFKFIVFRHFHHANRNFSSPSLILVRLLRCHCG